MTRRLLPALAVAALAATATSCAALRPGATTFVSGGSSSSPAAAGSAAVRIHTRTAAVNGGRPFSSTSPWNVPTPAGTHWYNHVRLHQLAGTTSTLHWWVNNGSVGIYYAAATDPTWTFRLPALNATQWHRVRPASTFVVRGPAGLRDGGDSDHVLVLVSGDTYLEVWNASVDSVHRVVTGSVWAKGSITNSPGAGSTVNDGTRASNLSWAGGLITGDDLQSGSIDHALALAVTQTMLKAGPTPSYVFPATAWDNGGSAGPLRIGSRIGIPAGTPRPAGLSHIGNMVFDALQKYGAFIGDYCGGAWPTFYVDKRTVTAAQIDPLYAFWNHGGKSDLDRIQPLLRVANYQP